MQAPAIELLHVKQAARELDVHEITCRKYIATGQLRAVRVGGRVRVPREALAEFVRPYTPNRKEQS
jgi:excisionase family DNA binding protein